MSVILKAIKSVEKDKDTEPENEVAEAQDVQDTTQESNENPNVPDQEEGFFTGSQSELIVEEKKTTFNLNSIIRNKRVLILGGALVLILAFIITYKLFFRDTGVRKIPHTVQIVKNDSSAGKTSNLDQKESPVNAKKSADDAMAAYEQGDYDKSMKLFKAAISVSPDKASLHNSLGLVFVEKELFSSAEAEFQKALELDSNCSECFNNLGMLKSLLGETVEAQKYLEKAVALDLSYPEPYFNLAVLYEKNGDFGNAVQFYRRFVELYPDEDDGVISKVQKRIKLLQGI